jgi:hypothetical protein
LAAPPLPALADTPAEWAASTFSTHPPRNVSHETLRQVSTLICRHISLAIYCTSSHHELAL